MNTYNKGGLALLGLLLLAACSGPQVRDQGTYHPDEPAVPATPQQESARDEGVVRPGPETSSAAMALLVQASREARDGNLEATEGLLERALRIEPSNAVIWHYFARLRFAQGRMTEAASAAARSNALGRDQPRLQADNARLIARARALAASD